jgi:hypothetical protein
LWLTRIAAEDGLSLGDPATRLIDHDFGCTDPRRGVLWRLWEEGLVDPLVSRADAESCLTNGPPQSRDWGRGRLIQKFLDAVRDVDWQYVDFGRSGDAWSPRLRIDLPRLDSLNRQFEPLIDAAADPQQLGRMLEHRNVAAARDVDPLEDMSNQLSVSSD